MRSFLRTGSEFLWLGVLWVFTDCIASIKLAPEVDLPDRDGSSSQEGQERQGRSHRVILVDKLSQRLFRFHRGELVVLKSPEEPNRRLLRRLIGIEGDWVSVEGKVEQLPKGNCWVEADSGMRAPGGDSRAAWGPVPLALIEGRASHVLWPPTQWGPLRPHLSSSGTRVVGKGGSLEFLTPPDEEDNWWA